MGPLVGSVLGPFVVAVLITDLELTEVVAMVYALGTGSKRLTYGLLGAVAGVAVVGTLGLVAGAALTHFPLQWTLLAGAVVLYAFGLFLFRSTGRTYYREAQARADETMVASKKFEPDALGDRALFGAALSVSMVETAEAVIVLVGLAAAGSGWEALEGFIVGGAILVCAGFILHERIRRLKVPALKWVGTSLLFTFAMFWTFEWADETGRLTLPSVPIIGSDILVLPLFLMSLVLVRAGVQVDVRRRVAAHRTTRAGEGSGP